ncbi:Nuclear transport factor 2 [Linnemannia gamsii]|uniref:Nuclear transport factor 2 n=1 Tax=Linnemannia gamsii TaxID=64522 RepID=A0ABQ7K790_9FUNG|nr:Nuclear transport factor 2 [Linnemannia gamsii]
MADINAVAQQFVTYYYQTFDANRAGLGPLYRPNSMLSFEGAQTQGADAVVEKLASLPLDGLRHNVSTMDAQPADGGVLVLVTGQLLASGESNPQFFTQNFLLKPDGGSYYIQNDIFRLVYGL